MKSSIFSSILALTLAAPHAEACKSFVGPAEIVLDVTNYAPMTPMVNGVDQGNCKGGAKGESPCRHLLEDYLVGRVPTNRTYFPGEKVTYVMSAIPQRTDSSGIKRPKERRKVMKHYTPLEEKYRRQTGKKAWTPSANMIGAYYRAVTLEQNLFKETGKPSPCIVIGAMDRYATSSNGLSKMDIATVNANPYSKKNGQKVKNSEVIAVANSDHATFLPLGRIEGIKPPKAVIQRNPEALTYYRPAAVDENSVPPSDLHRDNSTAYDNNYDSSVVEAAAAVTSAVSLPETAPIPKPLQRLPEGKDAPIPTPNPRRSDVSGGEKNQDQAPKREPASIKIELPEAP